MLEIRNILHIKCHERFFALYDGNGAVINLIIMVFVSKHIFARCSPDRVNDDIRPEILDVNTGFRFDAEIPRQLAAAPHETIIAVDDENRLRQFLNRIIHHFVQIPHDIAAITRKPVRPVKTAFARKSREDKPNHGSDRRNVDIVA